MVIFCVYTRKRAKKPPNSEAYTRIEKRPSHHNLRTIQKKSSRLFFSLYVYVYAQRNHSLISPQKTHPKNSISYLYLRHRFLQCYATKYPNPTNKKCTLHDDSNNEIYTTISHLFLNAENELNEGIKNLELEWIIAPLASLSLQTTPM